MIQYIRTVLIAVDILVNSIFGGNEYQTVSCRIGLSIQSGGWAAHIPWPASWRDHFLKAVFEETV